MDDTTPKQSLRLRLLQFVRRYFFPLVLMGAVLVLLGVYELGRASVYRKHPELTGAEQASAMLTKVGTLIQLPSGEAPTMATINDAASAKSAQPFLTNAVNGDVLIVYPNAQTALLYRPSTNKLIAVGPVSSTEAESQVKALPPAPKPVATTTDEATSTTTSKR